MRDCGVRALALFTTLLAVSAQAGERRGAFAFHYRAPLTPRQLRWFSRFDLLVTHDPLPRAQVDALRARGTKLLVYEWSVVFYGSLANEWQRALLQQRPAVPRRTLAPRAARSCPERQRRAGEGRRLQDGAPHPRLRRTFSPRAGRRI